MKIGWPLIVFVIFMTIVSFNVDATWLLFLFGIFFFQRDFVRPWGLLLLGHDKKRFY